MHNLNANLQHQVNIKLTFKLCCRKLTLYLYNKVKRDYEEAYQAHTAKCRVMDISHSTIRNIWVREKLNTKVLRLERVEALAKAP